MAVPDVLAPMVLLELGLVLVWGLEEDPRHVFPHTLGAEDVFHREMSPADRLGRGGPEQRKRGAREG